jgi:hypothetical protein
MPCNPGGILPVSFQNGYDKNRDIPIQGMKKQGKIEKLSTFVRL